MTTTTNDGSGRSNALLAILVVVFGVLIVRVALPGSDEPTENGFDPGYELPLLDEGDADDGEEWIAPPVGRDPFDPTEAPNAPQAQRTTTEPTE